MRTSYDIPESIAKLIDVFTQNLAGVRFPGVDSTVLEQAAAATRAAADRLVEAEAVVEAARRALHETERELLQKAQRAHAYARIYAEEAPALAALLDPIVLKRDAAIDANTAPEPRKRGRPRKEAAATPLFAVRDAETETHSTLQDPEAAKRSFASAGPIVDAG